MAIEKIVFQTDDGKYGLKIDQKYIKELLKYCTRALPNETGGIIIGYYSDDLKFAIITEVTGPPSDSISKRRFFYRGLKGIQRLLDARWKKKCYYLGEWHFHPFASPVTSDADDLQMKILANDRLLHCPEPILLILGGNPTRKYELKAYVYARNKKLEFEAKE